MATGVIKKPVSAKMLRTPLSASLGYVETMLPEIVGPLTDGQALYLSPAQDNIRRLARLINDLLDFALAELEPGSWSGHAADRRMG